MIGGLLGQSWDDPKTMGLLQLAASLQGSPKVMQGLAQGLMGYQGAMQQGKRAKAEEEDRALRRQAQQMQLQQVQQEAARRQGIDAAYRGAFRTPQQMAMAANGGPTIAAAQAAPGMAPGIDQNALLQGLAQADPQSAYQMLAPKGPAKIKEFREVRAPDGSVQIVGLDEFGKVVDTGQTPFKSAEVRDFGGFLGGIDPLTGKVQKLGDKTMSQAERDASARGWAGVRQGEQRLALDRNPNQRAPAGYRYASDGVSLEAIPGGPADKPQQATEGERKAATLMSRMEGSLDQLTKVTSRNQSARSPELIPSVLGSIPGIGGVAANAATSADRQRVEAAQLDILDAALTLGTGAAYTKEQLQGYRKSYFPQIGDDPATVRDKAERLDNVLQAARIAAGRAAPNPRQPSAQAMPAVPANPDWGGWSMKPIGGN